MIQDWDGKGFNHDFNQLLSVIFPTKEFYYKSLNWVKFFLFSFEAIFVLHVNLIGNLVVTFLNKMSEQNFFKGSVRFFLRSSARPWIIDQEVSNHQTFLNKPLICWQVYQIFFFWSRNKQSQIFFLSWHSTTIDIF